MELLAQYGLFLAKIATVVVAIAVITALIVNLTQRKKQRGELRVTNLSEQYKEMREELAVALLDGPQQKVWHKAQKKKHKQEAKAARARRESSEPSVVVPSITSSKSFERDNAAAVISPLLKSAPQRRSSSLSAEYLPFIVKSSLFRFL